MEVFNEWYSKNYPLPPTIEPGPITRDFKNGCNEAWEAALKWIYYEGVLDPSLAGDLIKKELPDGSV